MDRFQYHLAAMFLWWPSTKIVQVVMICQKNVASRVRGLIFLYIYIENFKIKIFVRNRCTDFIITWQKCFLVDRIPRLFKLSWFIKKPGRQGAGLILLVYLYQDCSSWFIKKPGRQGAGLILLVYLYQDCSSWFIKKPGRQGAGLILLVYLYRKVLKNLLVRNQWTDFSITWKQCFFGDPLPRLFKPLWFVKKHGR